MYFPYLRGRQFELIALRELLENDIIGNHIIPVVEPIKPTATLTKTLQLFVEKRKRIILVINPNVGDFPKNFRERLESEDKIVKDIIELVLSEQIIRAYHVADNTKEKLSLYKGSLGDTIAICSDRDALNTYLSLYRDENPKFTFIPDDRRLKRSIMGSKVLQEDHFEKASRNADYLDNEDEFFSDDHLFYKQEGFAGFSDYSVVGSSFDATGFAPLAVAIHLVYFNQPKELRIHHFVSDSNDDIRDPARKFGEAVSKLVEWVNEDTIHTKGLDSFIACFRNGKYPGLGTIKKYSIMHHIELMNKYLEGEI